MGNFWSNLFGAKRANTDGGPKTSLFSFDRERERQMAERYSQGNVEWVDARFELIDQVLAYRRTGELTPSLLEACESEFRVAHFAYSVGISRLVELAADGHEQPAARLETLMASKSWRERYEVILRKMRFEKDPVTKRELVRRGLRDRSSRIRKIMALEATFDHLIDMADELERVAAKETDERVCRAIFDSAYYLRRNEMTGSRGRYGGGSEDDARVHEAAWQSFVKTRGTLAGSSGKSPT